MKVRRIIALARKEWREILRDRLFFTLAFVVPNGLYALWLMRKVGRETLPGDVPGPARAG